MHLLPEWHGPPRGNWLVAERLDAVRRAHGPDAVALYAGNPTAHDHGAVSIEPVSIEPVSIEAHSL